MYYNSEWGNDMHLIEHVETQKAMGGSVQIGLIMPGDENVRLIFDTLWLELFRFEKAASRFLATSELTYLNKYGEIQHGLSPILKKALLAAKKSAVMSENLYNPFVLPAIQRAGYLYSVNDKEQKSVDDFRNRRIVDVDELHVGDDWVKIPYGTAIDLGGCGKGHIIDELANLARANGAVGGWIDASGDIYAWGTDADNQPITIALQALTNDAKGKIISVPVEGMGIATSGTFARPGVTFAGQDHHIIDPRTGMPAVSDIRLATVCAKTGLEADVLASTAIILGSADAPAFLSRRGVSDFVLQLTNEAARPVQYHGQHILARKEERQYA